MKKNDTKNSVGLVQTRYFTFAEPPNELILESKEKLLHWPMKPTAASIRTGPMPFSSHMLYPEMPMSQEFIPEMTENPAGGIL